MSRSVVSKRPSKYPRARFASEHGRRERPFTASDLGYLCESLEQRLVLDAGPTLYLQGTSGNDNLTFDVSSYKDPEKNFAYTYDLDFRGQIYDEDSFGAVVLNTLGGNDHVTVNAFIGNDIVTTTAPYAHSLTINLGGGTDTVQVNYGAPGVGISDDIPVQINGGGGLDSLVSNTMNSVGIDNIYEVSGSAISITGYDIYGDVDPASHVLGYSGMQNLTVFTSPNGPAPNYGPYADHVNILASDATLTNVVVSPNHNSICSVSGGISAPVYITGGNGTNAFYVDGGVGADVGLAGGNGSNALSVYANAGNQVLRIAAGVIGADNHAISYTNVNSVSVTGGYASDTLDVVSTSVPTTVSTAGSIGTVHVGDDPLHPALKKVQNLNAPLTVTNAALILDDASDTSGQTFVVGNGTILTAYNLAILIPSGLVNLTINGGSAGNLFNIGDGPNVFATTINTGTGLSNTVQVQALQALLTVLGQGASDQLTVNDTFLSTGYSYVLTTGVLFRALLSVNYSGLAFLNVVAGSGNDSFNFGNGTIEHNLAQTIQLDGGAGSNQITVDSHLSTGYNEGYDVTASSVSESWKFGPLGSFHYANFAGLVISADNGNNAFNVTSIAATTPVQLFGNDGNDTFGATPINGFGNISVLGQLRFAGGNGTDDASFVGAVNPQGIGYTLTGAAVVLIGGGVIGPLMTYDGLEALTVNTGTTAENFTVTSTSIPTTLNTGGNDVINVTPVVPNLDALLGLLTVHGNHNSTLNLSDQGNPSTILTQYIFNSASLVRITQTLGFINGTPTVIIRNQEIDYSGLGSIVLKAGGPNVVQVEGTAAGTPITINPNAATSTVVADETNPSGPVILGAGGTESVVVNNDAAGSATLLFKSTQTVGAVSVAAGGIVGFTAGAGRIVTVSSLTFSGTGKLDMNNDEMIVPATTTAVRTLLHNGQVYTSATGRAVGYLDIGGGNTEMKSTLPGDTNLDGKVNFSDMLTVAQHYNVTSAFWASGDFNYDSSVNFTDLVILAQHYGLSIATQSQAALTATTSHARRRTIDVIN